MNRTVKKIVLVLIIIIILPGLFFTAYEINQINDSEKVLEDIYTNQLDAILFSVNLYSQDIVSGWRSSINSILLDEPSDQSRFKTAIDSFLNLNNSISEVYFSDSILTKQTTYISSLKNPPARPSLYLPEFLERNTDKVKRLITYKRGGYNRIEPLASEATDSNTVLIFLLNDPRRISNICIMLINNERFVKEILDPQIRQITQNEELIITCTEVNTNRIILANNYFEGQEIFQKKSLWLIPKYELGILPQGETIQSIIDERTNTSIVLIVILTGILIGGVFIIFRNIRREVELAQIKSDFVSNVSHELRTPLALISMFSETLEMGRVRTEEKKQEYYSIISREANRLSRIVNKILSFSKIEAGKREYHFSETDLNKVTGEVYSTYQFHLQNSGFKFNFIKSDKLPFIKADGEAVSEAIINLIDNGAKYSSDVKEITITTGLEKNNIFIEVSDKGIGISEEDQKKIFEKFFRVTDGLVHNTKGTGLGLTLVKHIMDAHKGEIKVKSKTGEGSSFVLLFPV